jgi:hypothetical protein
VIDWHGVRDVYGSAADIPVLLEAAAASTDWEAPAWQELWSRLYHQGSVAPASYAALPRLAQVATGRPEVAVDPGNVLVATADPDDLGAAQVVLPADPGSLDAAQAHLLGLCHARGRADTAASLLQLFGETMCPHCLTRFKLGAALT